MLGFAAIDQPDAPEDAVNEFIEQLPAPLRNRLNIKIPELQILIASRVNALES